MSTAKIFNTHRMVSDDGPGLRTTLFLKGCPLNCRWCHNPESISPALQVWCIQNKCIHCGICGTVCQHNALKLNSGCFLVDQKNCKVCGECVKSCPSKALQFTAEEWTVDKAFKYVLKDKAYYKRSGGGVTISGGEPTMLYSEFVFELFTKLKNEGIHTALDTCGFACWKVLEKLLPVTDLFLWDIKTVDDTLHKEFTGVSNKKILKNLFECIECIKEYGQPSIWVRTPLIPGMTADQKNIFDIARLIAYELKGSISRWELCAFNNSCGNKYRRLQLEWKLKEAPLMTESEIEQFRQVIKRFPQLDQIVHFTGITAK